MANSPKKPLSAEASAIINSKFSRRALVAGAGALGGAALLSSCSSGGDEAASAGSVSWGNWPLYLDYDKETQLYPIPVDSVNAISVGLSRVSSS